MNQPEPLASKKVEAVQVQLMQTQARAFELRTMLEDAEKQILGLKNTLAGVGVGESLAKEKINDELDKQLPPAPPAPEGDDED